MLGSDHYPMQQGAGAFLICVGIALIWGSLDPPRAFSALQIGMGAGAMAILVIARHRRRIGRVRPTVMQIGLMMLAVPIELIIFAAAFPLVPPDVRLRWIAALSIVGAHFVVMRWSLGAPIALLGLSEIVLMCVAYVSPSFPLNTVIATDGALKAAFGFGMFVIGSRFAPVSGAEHVDTRSRLGR